MFRLFEKGAQFHYCRERLSSASMHYDLSTLSNGLRVITETMPGVRSVAIGAWVDAGTRDERPNEAGAAHFLEHLLFKGSEDMSARYISETFDALGAQSNAFTSKEATCFWARMVDEDLPTGLKLIGEMLQRPAFRIDEIDSERLVVVEEINMSEDDPHDVTFESFTEAMFAGHPLERPILGTRDSIRSMSRGDIHGFWNRRYGVESTVLSVAGNVDHKEVVAMAEDSFGSWDGAESDHDYAQLDLEPSVRIVHRDTEQSHLVIGGSGLARGDDRRFAYELMNHVLGGGMSSRLFQSIREDRGLAYAVYSFAMPYGDVGAWGIYAGTTPENTDTVLNLILEELDMMISKGVADDELERAKGNVRGSLALSLEDANSRMMRLGRQEVTGQEHLSVGERIERLNAVTGEDVLSVAADVLLGPKVIAGVGPNDPTELEQYIA